MKKIRDSLLTASVVSALTFSALASAQSIPRPNTQPVQINQAGLQRANGAQPLPANTPAPPNVDQHEARRERIEANAADRAAAEAAARAEQQRSVDRLGMRGVAPSIIAFQRTGGDQGYPIPAPYSNCAPLDARAFKYISTDDRNGLDNRHRGIQGDPARVGDGFENLRAALARHGLTAEDVRLEFSAFRLATDRFAVDATPQRTESRTYAGADWRIRVRNPQNRQSFPVALSGRTSHMTLRVSYNDPNVCTDDRITGEVTAGAPEIYRSDAAAVMEIGEAMLRDIAGRSVHFRFDSFQPAMRNASTPDTFSQGDIALGARFTAGTAVLSAVIPRQ